MERFKHYLVAGLVIIIPISITILMIAWFVSFVEWTLAPILDNILGWHLPGLGLLAAFLAVLGTGYLASHVVGRQLLRMTNSLLLHMPGVKWIYGTLQQVVEAFSPENEANFKQVVLVEYPRLGVLSLGFVTGEARLDVPGQDPETYVSVYIPTNHFVFGEYAFFRRNEVTPTLLTVQQGIQCVLSAGAAIRNLPTRPRVGK